MRSQRTVDCGLPLAAWEIGTLGHRDGPRQAGRSAGADASFWT